MKYSILALSILTLAACSSDTSKENKQQDRQESNLVNGKQASDYYKQFIYDTSVVKNEETGKETKYFHFLTGSGFKDRVKLTEDIYGTIDIAMYEDGTYKYYYSESKRDSSSSLGGTSYTSLLGITGKGNWRVQDAELILEGIGIASGIMVSDNGISFGDDADEDEKPGIALSFEDNINRKGLLGEVIILSMSSTWSSAGQSPVDGWEDFNNEKE